MIARKILPYIKEKLKPGFVVGLFGARRTGKTVLLKQLLELISGKSLIVSGEDFDVQEILSSQKLSLLKSFTSGYTHLFIDEAQKIPGIGVNLKLIVDNIPEISVFFTGSSSFELYRQIGEPLTGRSIFFNLFGFSQEELDEDFLGARKTLENKLIYGLYPQVYLEQSLSEKEEILLDQFRSKGMEINYADKDSFLNASKPVYDHFEEMLGADTIQKIIEIGQNY